VRGSWRMRKSLLLPFAALLPLLSAPVESGGRSHLLSWVGPVDPDFAGTLIRYSLSSFPETPGDGLPLPNGREGRFPAGPGSAFSFLHDGLLPGETYYYSVFAYDDAGNHSAPVVARVPPNAPPDRGFLEVWGSGPNPFNGAVEVSWEIRARQRVDVKVYDVSGQEVRSLAGGPLPPGRHRLLWDGRDGRGFLLPSGVYFVRVRAELASKVLKTVLLR
jgi:hypothetical protein